MSALRSRSNKAVRVLAAVLLMSAVFTPAAPAAVVRDARAGTATLRSGAGPAPVRAASRPVKRSKIPLSVKITASDSVNGTMDITGGTPPFTVSMVGDAGALPVYSGSSRSVKVPLVAGETDYQVTSADLKYSEASGWGTTRFWVANTATRMVRLYDAAEDTVTASVWVRGDDTTSAVSLRNVVVRPSDDHVFVVFGDNVNGLDRNRLVELDAAGSFVATISVPGSYKIQDATFDASGNIYVCDRGSGTGMGQRIRIVKLDPDGAYLDSTQTVLPAEGDAYYHYPLYNLTTMIEYQASTDTLIARINTGTFAVIDPATLAIEDYRYSGDYCYTCMTLNTSDETSVTLYTGGSGFYLPSFFGKQPGFLNDSRYEDPSIIQNPFHEWIVMPALPAITDVACDSNDYVYTMQHDGANGITRAYVVNPDGSAVKTIDLPDGTRIAVVW